MAHFAELDGTNTVTQVVVVNNAELLDNGVESEAKGIAFLQGLFGHDKWRQTSYSGKIRKQFAGLGYSYDATADVFIAPQPFPSWTLDANHDWQPPTPKPAGSFVWDESTLAWVEIAAQQ